MYVCVRDGGWGVDKDWMPLPARPQRHCDPASLVGSFFGVIKDSVLKSSTLSFYKAQKWAFRVGYPAKSSELSFLLKKLNSELLFIKKLILAYFLKTAKGFDNLNEFLTPKSIIKWKIKKIEGCHVRDFHLSIFLQSKKMIKIHTYTPISLHHIAVAQTFSQKKN